MSAIQELAPFIGAYHGKIRNAKDHSGMTLEELPEKSGVSFSTVSRLYAGTQADPRLYNSAAICKALGLSLNELFGLENPVGSPEKLTKQIHHVELENAKLEAATALQSAACIALIVGSVLASAITFYAIRKERGGKHGVHQV